jgi:NAD(P)-dependent dehydrogenase (short-subunit alcohol dehydrogenase family)
MASKGAVNSFSKGIAFEFAKSKIRSNVIQPGMVVTNLTKVINDKEIEDDIKRYPLGRYGTPQEIAYAAIYLLSDASAWVTGTKLVVDGGITLR